MRRPTQTNIIRTIIYSLSSSPRELLSAPHRSGIQNSNNKTKRTTKITIIPIRQQPPAVDVGVQPIDNTRLHLHPHTRTHATVHPLRTRKTHPRSRTRSALARHEFAHSLPLAAPAHERACSHFLLSTASSLSSSSATRTLTHTHTGVHESPSIPAAQPHSLTSSNRRSRL